MAVPSRQPKIMRKRLSFVVHDAAEPWPSEEYVFYVYFGLKISSIYDDEFLIKPHCHSRIIYIEKY